jgi:hypothetical protein
VSKNPSKNEYQNLNDLGEFCWLTYYVRKLQFIDITSIAERLNRVSRSRVRKEARPFCRKEWKKEEEEES